MEILDGLIQRSKMKLHEFISLNSIFVGVNVDSKKNVFKTVANFFEKKNPELSGKITEKLNEREKLGTTAVGNGVAIPHTKIEGLKKTQVLFIKLNTKIDFSASDEKFVDIIFSIITPETSRSEHLLILSAISNFLKKKGCIEKLRKLDSAEEIYKLFGLA